MDLGIARVELGEGALPLGLQRIVELLAEALLDLLEDALRLEAPRAQRAEHPLEHAGVVEIALDGAGDARVLHLDGHAAPVVEGGTVHLADGGAGEGGVLPLGEELFDRRAQILLDGAADGRRRGARRGGAQAAQRGLVGGALLLRHHAVDVARHLADLGGDATQGAQHLGGVPGRRGAVLRQEQAGAGARAEGREPGEAPDPAGGEATLIGHPRCWAGGEGNM